MLLLLAVIFLPMGYLVYKGICELASLITNYPALFGKADTLWCSCCERVAEITGMKTETMVQWGKNCAAYVSSQAETKLIPAMMNGSLASLRGLAAFFGICIVTVVAAVLILCDYDNLVQRWRKSSFYSWGGRIFQNMCHAGGTYLKAQLIIFWREC